jgi:hypothetical protein
LAQSDPCWVEPGWLQNNPLPNQYGLTKGELYLLVDGDWDFVNNIARQLERLRKKLIGEHGLCSNPALGMVERLAGQVAAWRKRGALDPVAPELKVHPHDPCDPLDDDSLY